MIQICVFVKYITFRIESAVPWDNFTLTTGVTGSISMPDGGNVRKVITDIMRKLQNKILNSEDTRSLCKLVNVR